MLHVSVPGVASLAPMVIDRAGGPMVRGIRVKVGTWRPPKGWTGSPNLASVSEFSLRRKGDGVTVSIASAAPVDPAILIAAAMRILRPTHLDPGPLMTITPGLPVGAVSLASAVTDVIRADDKPNRHLRRTDTLVMPASSGSSAAPGGDEPAGRSRTVVISSEGWEVDGTPFDIVVDPAVHRPLGRKSEASGIVTDASIVDGTLVIGTPQGEVRARGDLTPSDVHQLRSISGVRSTGELPIRWRAQLEAAGVLVAAVLPESGRFPEPDDGLGWQLASVHARRQALRAHSPIAALDAWPTVSAVIVTHRTEFLAHALAQIAGFEYPSLQVVVGLHGVDIADGEIERLIRASGLGAVEGREVVVHRIGRDVPFGRAMQAACDRADGVLITKVDDDDHYAPEHVWDLVLARMYSGAQLVGKALDWIHVQADDVTAFRPVYPAESYATFVAGGTMLISKADLLAAGGWRPVPKSIDRALIEQVKRIGGLVYRTHGLGYVYVRHGAEHTAVVSDEHFLTQNARQWPGLIAHEAFGTVQA